MITLQALADTCAQYGLARDTWVIRIENEASQAYVKRLDELFGASSQGGSA